MNVSSYLITGLSILANETYTVFLQNGRQTYKNGMES